jgi:hypothetical protein
MRPSRRVVGRPCRVRTYVRALEWPCRRQ